MFMVHRKDIASNYMAPIFDSYEWWLDLAKNALEDADEFEMRLWEDNVYGIKSGERFGVRVPNNMSKEIVFKGKVTEELKQEILTNFLTDEGYIKWFTLILKKDDKHIFLVNTMEMKHILLLKQRNKLMLLRNGLRPTP